MSEEKKNGFLQKAGKLGSSVWNGMQKTGKTVGQKVHTERQKSKLKSEIRHNERELDHLYRRLDEGYYRFKKDGTEITGEAGDIQLIDERRADLSDLDQKLDALRDKE